MTERPPATLQFQADFIEYLIRRCHVGGKLCPETWMVIKAEDIEELRHIAQRLRRFDDLNVLLHTHCSFSAMCASWG